MNKRIKKQVFTIGTQVKMTGYDLIGTLVSKGFKCGDFVYTVEIEGKIYNVQEVENI